MSNDPIVLICLLSNKSAIGDGFLDLVNNIPDDILSDCLIVKTDAYAREKFPLGLRGCFDLKLSKNNLSFASILDFITNLVLISKLSKNGRLFIYGVSPLNHLMALFLPAKMKTVWVHDPDIHPGARTSERLAWYLIKLMFMLCSKLRVLVSSNYLLERVLDVFKVDPANVDVVPFPYLNSIVGINESVPHPEDSLPQVLFFGRVEPYKGIGVLLKSTSILVHEKLEFVLRIAGKGQLTGLENMEQVQHLNAYVPDNELRLLIRRSIVCVFPYSSATGTQALQTALALGVPCIVTDIPAFRCISSQVDGKGVFFVNNEDELTNTLRDFILGRITVNCVDIRDAARHCFNPDVFGRSVSNII